MQHSQYMAHTMNDAGLKLFGWFYEAFTLLANAQPNLPVSDAFTLEFLFEKYVSHMRHLFDKTPIWNAYLIVRIYLSPGIHHLAIAIQSAFREQLSEQ